MRYYLSGRSSNEDFDVPFDNEKDYLDAIRSHLKDGWTQYKTFDESNNQRIYPFIMTILVRTKREEAKRER